MALTGQQIADMATKILNDGGVRWTAEEMLLWVNAGIIEIHGLKPNAFAVNGNIDLVAGTKQSIPATASVFIGLVRNMGANGATPGRVITPISREKMDANLPGWHTAPPDAVATNGITDPRDPRTFYVFPPSPGGVKAEGIYSVLPAPIVALANDLTIGAEYTNVLVDYVLYRCHSKPGGNAEKAKSYFAVFRDALTSKGQVEQGYAPKATDAKE